ncbi:MAG: inorganic pyrophosphatase [Bacteroidetes bacterium]|jgi:inorganic pyrophosphatase|nr:inorganic pyrophosphatase [Bacteroidota bacterium]
MNIPLFKPHPWHGIQPGKNVPDVVTAYIEIVPTDTIKYEIDKVTGYRKVDRPQKFSNIVPALYGFIPQTYCGTSVAEYATTKAGKAMAKGDGDPLDILVLTEHIITTGDIILEAKPIGGLRMFDKDEIDDKIIAVMVKDEIYSQYMDISEVPESIIRRLKHYFLTYKNLPGAMEQVCEITHTYGRSEAQEVIRRSLFDYQKEILEKNVTFSNL